MKFVVRDDDACALTRPEELEQCWAPVWQQVPVCLSVTPFRIPGYGRGVPDGLVGSEVVQALEEGTEIFAFIKENLARGRFDIALHGYDHARIGDAPEFVAGRDLGARARDGRACLERLFDRPVTTFVPPNNSLSEEGYDAVIAAGMNIVSNQTRARIVDWWSSPGAAWEALFALRYSVDARHLRPNRFRVRRFPRYRQAPYHTVGPEHDLKALLGDLEECRRQDGVFIMATHYHAFDRRMSSGETIRDGVMKLIDQASRFEDVQFVGYGGLW